MPIPLAVGVAGAELVGQGANILFQGSVNRKSRAFGREMFNLQNQRDVDFWNLKNEYDSPQAQMERLQKAGLNPNLVYGHGAVATSGSLSGGSPPSWSPKAPEVSLGSAATRTIDTHFDTQMKSAQLDNLKAQNTNLLLESKLKEAQTRATLANAGLSEFNLGFRNELRPWSADIVKEEFRSKNLSNRYSENTLIDRIINQNLRNDLMGVNIQQKRLFMPDQLELLKQGVLNMKQRFQLNEYEKSLNASGLTKSDPTYMRLISLFLQSMGVKLK